MDTYTRDCNYWFWEISISIIPLYAACCIFSWSHTCTCGKFLGLTIEDKLDWYSVIINVCSAFVNSMLVSQLKAVAAWSVLYVNHYTYVIILESVAACFPGKCLHICTRFTCTSVYNNPPRMYIAHWWPAFEGPRYWVNDQVNECDSAW